MRREWRFWEKDEPPPIEASGELERVPRYAGTATAIQQVHLRVTMENKAAETFRAALERDGKRIASFREQGQLMAGFCVDVPELDLQRFTGTVRVCSCDAFDLA
jgi:hypothetical protein